MSTLTKNKSTEELASMTLADIVTENIRSAIVFEEYGMDFCCRGKRSLKDACAEKNINVQKIVDDLKKLSGNSNGTQNINDWQLDFFVDYIINNHHQYVRRMVPVISLHSDKVASVHGNNHPETKQIADIFLAVREELEGHMMKEERILFPYIKQMFNAKKENSPLAPPPFGSVQNPIRMMEFEHVSAGEGFEKIKDLSTGYSIPADACDTFKALYSELKEFEEDLHKHIHLENNILFPKSVELEEMLFRDNS